LTILDFILVARLFDYFVQYDIPYIRGFVKKEGVLKVMNEFIFPLVISPNDVEQAFEKETSYNFIAFSTIMFSIRHFKRFLVIIQILEIKLLI
jgi:hypothetical protein